MTSQNRPLSPHLQIYKPQITSVLSITHRATGVVLCGGLLLLVSWVVAIASGPEAYAALQAFNGSFLGRLLLFAWSLSLFYHLCNGIRHLFWDAGYGLEIEAAQTSGWAVVIATVVLTVAAWVWAYVAMGA